MKLIVTVIAMILPGTAFAQDEPAPASASSEGQSILPAMPDDLTLEQCWADLQNCYAQVTADNARYTALLAELAQRGGFRSVDEMLVQDCRSRRGTWQDNKCVCAEPSQWFTAETEECCVPNPRAYGWNKSACEDSGGTYSCRGGCQCPMGTQLLDGECVGEAATREEVDRLRARIPELEGELASLQAERDALQTQLNQAQADLARARELEGQLVELESSVEEMERQLVDMDAELSFLRHLREQYEQHIARQAEMIGELGGIPPAVPTPLPGTAEAVAEAAGVSEPGPLTPTPHPSPPEREESCWKWDQACPWVLIGSLLGAAGLTVGIYEAVREPPDVVRQYY